MSVPYYIWKDLTNWDDYLVQAYLETDYAQNTTLKNQVLLMFLFDDTPPKELPEGAKIKGPKRKQVPPEKD